MPAGKDKIADRVIDDLVKARILSRDDEIMFSDTFDIKYGYVIFDKDRKPAIEAIHKYLKTVNIIPCGRYGLWAYLWSDEAILSGKKAAEILSRSQQPLSARLVV